MAKRVMVPSLTAKPANGMMASLGTGMQALSSSIRKKTAGRPQSPMRSVAHWTTMSMMEVTRHRVPHAALRDGERGDAAACAIR